MGIKNYIILVLVFTVGLLPLFSIVNADDNVSINIHMISEQERTRFDNPVIVAGIWHFINVSLEDQFFQELILKFYNGDFAPTIGERNETNYYEWRYNSNSHEWTDVNEYGGYSYINETKCQKIGNIYSFCIGIKDTLPETINYHTNWTLEIHKDVNELYFLNVVLEKPLVGLARSHADVIKFNVNPYTKRDVEGDDYYIVENVGNIPLSINIDYEPYNNVIEIVDFDKTLSPNTTSNYNVILHTESWKPGILKISGGVIGYIPNSLIITTAMISLPTTVEINAADLEVSIGHSNYEIQIIPETHIIFQYEKSIEMNEGQIRDVTVYISGEGKAVLDISSDEKNITILEVSSKDQEGTPFSITSKNTSEYAVTVRIEALRENKVGMIYYELETDEETQTFSTQVTIGPPLKEKTSTENTMSVTAIIVVLCIIFVIGYIIFTQIRYKRR